MFVAHIGGKQRHRAISQRLTERLCTLLLLAWSYNGLAQVQTSTEAEEAPIATIGNEYQNSIQLLRNRFRVDHHVDVVTMVFFREPGSAPVVLVQPDGSKIFQRQADDETIIWYDADTYDMVTIKNPVPGPWQAVGQILPNSRIMVLSDIKLHADPFPPIIFSGEILKQTAYLTNGGKPVNDPQFRDVVTLDIDYISTNNPNYDNFGADSATVATFTDDGLGMDERPLDGVFTGQFNLVLPAGEWQPVFRVSTPMYTREQKSSPVILHPNPITLNVELNGGGNNYHKLIIGTNTELVDIRSLLFDGTIRYPNGDIQNFSLTEPSDVAREYLIIDFDIGIFRVKLTAYGSTADGRDFILDVPEFTFFAEAQTRDAEGEPLPPSEPSVGEETAEGDTAMSATSSERQDDVPTVEAEEAPIDVLFWILVVNGAILACGAIGVGGFFLWRMIKAKRAMKSGQSGE